MEWPNRDYSIIMSENIGRLVKNQSVTYYRVLADQLKHLPIGILSVGSTFNFAGHPEHHTCAVRAKKQVAKRF